MMRKTVATAMMTIGMLILCTMTASAYLEPSTVSYLLQVGAMVVIAGGAAVAIYWKKLKMFFKNRKAKKQGADAPAEQVHTTAPDDGGNDTVKIDLSSLDEDK